MVTVNLGMLHYVIDHVYGALMHRTKMSTPFFSRGWGCSKLELLVNLVNFVDLSKVFVEILSLSLLVCNVAKQSLVCY